ncbi:MAG: ATP-binding protein [Desulfobacterales bacterium]
MGYKLQRYINRRMEAPLQESLRSFPVTALLGPRQCGKSTLARHVVADRTGTVYLDLEKPSDLRKLDDAEFFFHTQKDKLICIDEVQMGPELFPVIRVAVDEDRRPAKFLILGSASQDLIRQSSETLAGRIHFLELTPFTYDELLDDNPEKYEDPVFMWTRGGFPEAVLAESDSYSFDWRSDFIRTFLERDIPQFGFTIPAVTMRRFWTMLAHYHGQMLNASKFGQALGVSRTTIGKYLDIMAQTFMVRILPPLMANIKKRLIKTPKVYLRDTGILHALLEIENIEDLLGHPIAGASWEGWCIEQILAVMPDWRSSFYRTSSGEEIDLIIERGRKRLAFEFKASMSPKLSRGFPGTLTVLQPDHTWIVAPVLEPYLKRPGVTVANIKAVLQDLGDRR